MPEMPKIVFGKELSCKKRRRLSVPINSAEFYAEHLGTAFYKACQGSIAENLKNIFCKEISFLYYEPPDIQDVYNLYAGQEFVKPIFYIGLHSKDVVTLFFQLPESMRLRIKYKRNPLACSLIHEVYKDGIQAFWQAFVQLTDSGLSDFVAVRANGRGVHNAEFYYKLDMLPNNRKNRMLAKQRANGKIKPYTR